MDVKGGHKYTPLLHASGLSVVVILEIEKMKKTYYTHNQSNKFNVKILWCFNKYFFLNIPYTGFGWWLLSVWCRSVGYWKMVCHILTESTFVNVNSNPSPCSIKHTHKHTWTMGRLWKILIKSEYIYVKPQYY